MKQNHTLSDTPAHAPTGATAPRNGLQRLLQQEDLNFLLTNRVPRIALTRFMGWYSQLQSPLLARFSIAVWKLFSDLDLREAQPQRYRSLHECFIRQLKPGMRPIDMAPQVLASPSDAIVGECGPVQGTQVFQAKGFPYTLADLFGPSQDTTPFHNGQYVTLRLTSSMYHRFHAPHDLQLQHVTFHSGDTWNVNPIALKRVEKLFCKNERAVLRAQLNAPGQPAYPIALVPVAAILVASLRLHALDLLLHLGWKGPKELPCNAQARKGEELGWFQHGSTIIVFVPPGFTLAPGIAPGVRIRMGQALMHLPAPEQTAD
jgi:phosphatidylserine decarboxylase